MNAQPSGSGDGTKVLSVLGYRDPLQNPATRILIAGVTGSGKSTLARQIATRLELPYTEIDSLYHGPNWTPREEFVKDVDTATSGDRWVIEWQYPLVRPMLLERADTLVWLDHPAALSYARVIRRTVRRSRTHEPLWNGNVEPPLRSFFTAPDENIIRWAIKTRRNYKRQVPAVELSHPQLQIVRLRSQRQVNRWLDSL
jgi:adenylate kinase family enzyme